MKKASFTSLFFIGALIGTANVIPGISGGSIALILGIYEKIIATANKVLGLFFFKNTLKKNDIIFCFLLGMGALSAIFINSFFLPTLLKLYPVYSKALCFGLILSSVYPLIKSLNQKITYANALLLILWLLLSVVFFGLKEVFLEPNPIVLFFSGLISIITMILPGVSGAMVLVFMGQYAFVLQKINLILQFNLEAFFQMIPFFLGAFIGFALLMLLLNKLLKKYHAKVMYSLLGMMLGGLVRLWPYEAPLSILHWSHQTFVILALMGCGFLVGHVFFLVSKTERMR